jgi:hypothetical protein
MQALRALRISLTTSTAQALKAGRQQLKQQQQQAQAQQRRDGASGT